MAYSIDMLAASDYDKNKPFLMEGFRRILGHEITPDVEKAYDEKIESKATTVFLVRRNSPYPFGFFTVDFKHECGALVAQVTDGFNSGTLDDNLLEVCLEKAKEYALCAGAEYVVFSSHREGWFRRAKKLGATLVRAHFKVDL